MNETEKRTILLLLDRQQKLANRLPQRSEHVRDYERFAIARNTLRDLAIALEETEPEIALAIHDLTDAITLG